MAIDTYVTPEDLEEADACPDQVEDYRAWLEDRGWSRARSPSPA